MGASVGDVDGVGAIPMVPEESPASGGDTGGVEYVSNEFLPWWLVPGLMCGSALIWLVKRLAILGYAWLVSSRHDVQIPPEILHHEFLEIAEAFGIVLPIGLAIVSWITWWQHSLRLRVEENGLRVARAGKSRFFPYASLEEIRFTPLGQLRPRLRPLSIQTADGVTKIGPWLLFSGDKFLRDLRSRIEKKGIDPSRFQALSPEIIENERVRTAKAGVGFGWMYAMILALLAFQFFGTVLFIAGMVLKSGYRMPLSVTFAILVAATAVGWTRVRAGESAEQTFLRARRKGLRCVLTGCVLSSIWIASFVLWQVWH